MREPEDAASSGLSALVGACSAVASGDRGMLERELGALADAVHSGSVTAVAAEEALLQCYLFLGYPAALRALGMWREVSGLDAPAGAGHTDVAQWMESGAATCQRVYGGQYERLRGNIAALHPDMEQWMVAEGYGKVLSRPGLPLWMRECCIIAVLAWQDAAPQLYSHLRGALNAGARIDVVERTVQQVRESLPPVRQRMVDEEWARVRSRRG